MSFIDTLLNRKKQSKMQKTVKKAGLTPEDDDLTEDQEDAEGTSIFDNAAGTSEKDCSPEEDSDVEYEVVEREILPAKIVCPDCGGITLEGLEFCDKCGGELQ